MPPKWLGHGAVEILPASPDQCKNKQAQKREGFLPKIPRITAWQLRCLAALCLLIGIGLLHAQRMYGKRMNDYLNALMGNQADIDRLLNYARDGFFVVHNERFSYLNDATAALLGSSREEIVGKPFIDFVAAADRERLMAYHQARLLGESAPNQYEFRVQPLAGESQRDVQVNLGVVSYGEHARAVVGTVRDITREKKLLAELHEANAALSEIIDRLPDIYYRTDAEGRITFISPHLGEALGYSREEVLGTPLADYYLNPEERGRVVEAIKQGNGQARNVEARLRHKDGSIVWISTNARMRFGPDGEYAGVEGVARDETKRKELEDRLHMLATVDEMTGTYNRRHFIERFQAEMQRAKRYESPLSLMIIDVDLFKGINDRYGHLAGDAVLSTFSEVLRRTIRQIDFVGRLGGEEFAVCLPETGQEQAVLLAERLREAIAKTEYFAAETKLSVTASIGVTEVLMEDSNFSQPFHRADQALYQAKNTGRNRVVLL